ncbi:site-specific integrase [Dysgonomonas sp. 521]|uniref:site-specific integrase n=1 Tax=Dysgonomonas sp. 521 TaxID=2302932 RepID=UPI0013CFD3A1|nr:site-specific integrase [Dysgonomonas sp. 521]NDV97280.1 site-specific integrase [Dysgonomonas sp. 521]
MYSYSKDGIKISVMIDTRRINSRGKYPVKIRVNYKRVRQYYSTGKELTQDEWDKLPELKSRQYKEIREDIENSFYLVRDNVELLAEKGEFSFHILNTRLGKSTGDTLTNAIRSKIVQLEIEERIGTMLLHKETLRLVSEFAGDNVLFDMVTVQWLKKCEAYWLRTGKGHTTIGMHMRNIRALMNEAKKVGVIKESQYPFGKDRYEIKTGEATKKALSLEEISKIYNFSDETEVTEKYKDLWIFIYMCNGINVADLVKLKYSDINDGEICFIRQKTERTSKSIKRIRVALTPEMGTIIKKWGNTIDGDNYIFPYLTGNETALERKTITRELTRRINKRIKRIAEAVGIGRRNISTYTARHSFATVLKRSGANIAYISESLGHNDLKTTEHYLANFEKEERIKNSRLLTNFGDSL